MAKPQTPPALRSGKTQVEGHSTSSLKLHSGDVPKLSEYILKTTEPHTLGLNLSYPATLEKLGSFLKC